MSRFGRGPKEAPSSRPKRRPPEQKTSLPHDQNENLEDKIQKAYASIGAETGLSYEAFKEKMIIKLKALEDKRKKKSATEAIEKKADSSGRKIERGPIGNNIFEFKERQPNALTGSEFARQILGVEPNGLGLSSPEIKKMGRLNKIAYENAVFQEIESGNVPNFLRYPKPIFINSRLPDGRKIQIKLLAMPSYLAIGTDEDFLEVSMSERLAMKIARLHNATLPTREMVDASYQNAQIKSEAIGLTGKKENLKYMTGAGMLVTHNNINHSHLAKAGWQPGMSVEGHKKNIVISSQVSPDVRGGRPNRLDFYGFFRSNGVPIQGNVPRGKARGLPHEAGYFDYSHGAKLYFSQMEYQIEGEGNKQTTIREALMDPLLNQIISDGHAFDLNHVYT